MSSKFCAAWIQFPFAKIFPVGDYRLPSPIHFMVSIFHHPVSGVPRWVYPAACSGASHVQARSRPVNFCTSIGFVQVRGGGENEITFCYSICSGPFSSSAGALATPRRAREESPSREHGTHSRSPSAPRAARQAGTRTPGKRPHHYHASRQQ